jgi:hypothetical protein
VAVEPILVTGLGDLQRTLKLSGVAVQRALNVSLKAAAEPIKADAERLSVSRISGMKRARVKPPPWSIQKLGTSVSEVYMVPTQRGKRFYRTEGDRRRAAKFKELMLGRSYEPALERNRLLVTKRVEQVIDAALTELNTSTFSKAA